MNRGVVSEPHACPTDYSMADLPHAVIDGGLAASFLARSINIIVCEIEKLMRYGQHPIGWNLAQTW